VGTDLHISNCFPTMSEAEAGEEEGVASSSGSDESSRHDARMCQHLQSFNMDYLTVGWYQSAHMSSFYTEDLIRGQYNYQRGGAARGTSRSRHTGSLPASWPASRARTSPQPREFVLAHAVSLFFSQHTPPAHTPYMQTIFLRIKKFSLTYENILECVPVVLKTSPLSKVLIDEVRGKSESTSPLARLDLASQQYLEKNLELLMSCVDELNS